jgi:hypothetical protein
VKGVELKTVPLQ